MRHKELEGLEPLSEAALSLRMNRERVLRRVMDGTIPGRKIGDRWYVDTSAIPRKGAP